MTPPAESTIRQRRAGEATSTDANRVRDHITLLRAAGMTYTGIARLAGCHRGTVRAAHRGEHALLWKRTGEAILGITRDAFHDHQKVPVWRSQRLIAEIRRAGLTTEDLAAVLRRSHKRGLHNLVGPDRVDKATQDKVVTLYRYLASAGRVPADVLEEVGI